MAVVALLLVATFYSPAHLRNRFGRTHSGQDIGGWRAGTSIPSPVAGMVAGSGWHRNYGYWVSIRLASGWYVTFSHMLRASSLSKGSTVRVGTLLGLVGASGSFAVGFHVHVGYGPGMYPWSRPTYDPLPIIRKGLQPAGGNTTPLPVPKKGNAVAIIIQHKDNLRTALVGDTSFRELTPAQLAVERRAWGGTYLPVSSDEWNTFATPRVPEPITLTPAQVTQISNGVKVDLSSVSSALSEGFAAITKTLLALPAATATYVMNLLKQQWTK